MADSLPSEASTQHTINHYNNNSNNLNNNQNTFLCNLPPIITPIIMRATTTILFIASLATTALGAATKMYDDENWYVTNYPPSTLLPLTHS